MGRLNRWFGDFSWTPPDWAQRAGSKRILAVTAGLVLVAAVAWGTLRYYASLPKPPQVVATAIAPGVTPITGNGQLRPLDLLINFAVVADPRQPVETVQSVARLDLIEENVVDGISISPAITGAWSWSTPTQLKFTPSTDWPAGQHYDVRYDKNIFTPKLEFATTQVEFTTPGFSAEIKSMEFYQDPVEQSLRKVVSTLNFTHPVDRNSLQRQLSLTMRASGDTVKTAPAAINYTVTYEQSDRVAYVHSTALEIPAHESYLAMQIKADLKPAQGPSRLPNDLAQSVRIPDIASYFRVRQARSLLVRNDDNDPVQTATLEFTDRVNIRSLHSHIQAYLLPVNVTINGARKTSMHWQSPREVTAEVLSQSTPIEIALNAVEHDAATLHSFAFDIPDSRHLYVRINHGLRSEGGFVLSTPYDTVLRAEPYPKEAMIAQDGALLPLTGSHRLALISRGVNTLKVELGRLLDGDVNHLASQTGGDIKNPYFNNYNFDETNLTARTTKFIDLNPGHPRSATFSSIDLSEFLSEGGHYFVTVQGWDKARNYAVGSSDKRFVLITDIGLLIKANADSTQDVFVHSIASGLPLAGASIELLGKNGVPIISRTSSGDGHTSMPATSTFEREKAPTVFMVRYGQDSVFMPYSQHARQLQYSRFDVGGDYAQQRASTERLRAQVFTERDLYRPGDTTYLGVIVKRADWEPLDRMPLIMNITDPRGQTVMDKRLSLPADGFFEEKYATEVASATGQYTATVYLVEKSDRRRAIGSHSFKVEEFQPDRLKIRSSISGYKPKGWLKPGALNGVVVLENLFGTAAENRRVVASYELAPSSLFFSEFKDFTFVDPLREKGSVIRRVVQTLPETQTDQSGKATIPLQLAQYDKGIYKLSLYTEGFEAGGGRGVKSQTSVMLSPLDYLVGYKADGDLGFIKKDAGREVQFLAVNSDGEPVALDNLSLEIHERRFVSSLVTRANGTYAYQSVLKENRLSSTPFAVGSNGTTYKLPTSTAGRYSVNLVDTSGLVYSKVAFVVAGARNLAGNLEKNAELELSLNGSSFKAGDMIEMEITAPYTGSGLITIEREKVFSYKWFTSTTTTSVQRIQVPDDLEGNAYVNVAYVRDLASPEVFVSPLSYAVKPFSVNRDARTVSLTLNTPELVKPGEDLNIDYTASAPSRIVIYAVDEGILQVAKYQQPDPLEFFLRKMALQVSTFQLVDLILPEFEAYRRAAAPGGGEAAGLLGKNLNPFRRKTDAPVVYWSGIVDAGPDTRTVTYKVPESFNGQLRVMAVAVSAHAVGHQKTSALVRAPFVITPNLLTAAAPGDEFDVNVGLSNSYEGSGKRAKITLAVTPSEHLEIIGERSVQLSIDEGREDRARFRVRAKHQLGAAELKFVASSGDESSRLGATLSVRPSVPYVATAMAAASQNDPVTLNFSRTLYDEFARQTAAASASPLVLADGLLEYLDAFPHACAEQMVSKVFPQLGFLGNQDYTVNESDIRVAFAQTTQQLRSRQMSSGGFRFWPSSQQAANFPSVYILHFFTDATQSGLTVPRDMMTSGLEFVRTIAAEQTGSLEQAQIRAYAIYVLTRNGTVTTNYLTNLHEYLEKHHKDTWRSSFTAALMAASYQQLQVADLAGSLIGRYKMQAGDEMLSDFDTRLGRDALYVYLVARHFPAQLASITPAQIQSLIEPVMKNRFNTLSSSYTIMALGAYTQAIFDKAGAPQLRIDASTNGIAQQLSDLAVFARAPVANGMNNVQVSGGGRQTVYHVLTQSGFDRVPPISSLSEGLEIFREYLDSNGAKVTQATVGSELTVQMRIRSTGARRTNIAVIDMLPGGFEILSDSVRNTYNGWNSDYFDIREDRLVMYGSFDSRVTTIRYKVKVTSAGDFVLPSAYAGSMYDRSIQARTAPGRFQVVRAQ